MADFRCFDIEEKYSLYIQDDNTRISNFMRAESDVLDQEILTKVLPKFKQGMSDINAVQSEAFVLGEALIWDSKVKTLAKQDAAIRLDRLNSQAEIALKRIGVWVEWARITTAMATELSRIYVASRHEIDALYAEINARDKLFDLTIYQYGVNVISSISGSAVSHPDQGPTRTGIGGALSGALSGAAMGAFLGGGVPGAVIGGALGLAGGLFA